MARLSKRMSPSSWSSRQSWCSPAEDVDKGTSIDVGHVTERVVRQPAFILGFRPIGLYELIRDLLFVENNGHTTATSRLGVAIKLKDHCKPSVNL